MEGLICVGILLLPLSLIALFVAISCRQALRDLTLRLDSLEVVVRDIRRARHAADEAPEFAVDRFLAARRAPQGDEEVSAPVPQQPADQRESPLPPVSVPDEPAPDQPGVPPVPETPEAVAARSNAGVAELRTTAPAATSVFDPAYVKPEPRTTLEEQLGTRLTVWIGAIALALAGAFLVKYTFDRNLLTPGIRVVLGLAFGAALLAAGEWMRRSSPRIAEGVSAAGVADLFACLLAATNLYRLISPYTGFAAMAAATALAVVLSLRQGPFVAALGLVGGFLTPALIHTGETRPPLFVYLLLLEIGLFAVTRHRRWLILTALTLIGAMAWAGLWLAVFFEPDHSAWIGGFLLASVAAIAFGAGLENAKDVSERDLLASRVLVYVGGSIGLILTGALANVAHYGWQEWSFLLLLGAGCMTLARLRPAMHGLPWIAAGVSLVMFVAWSHAWPRPGRGELGLLAAFFGFLYAGGAYLCLWRSQRPDFWAALSVLSGLAWTTAAWHEIGGDPGRLTWGAVALILAAAYTVASVPVRRRRASMPLAEDAFTVLAVGVVVLVSLAVWMDLEREWIAVAWAVEVPLVALVARRWDLPRLRYLALPLVALVLARLLLNPGIATYPLGPRPVLNWMLYGYGIPTLALTAAAWLWRRHRDDWLITVLEASAVVAGLALMTVEIRHYFQGDLRLRAFRPLEPPTYAVFWLLGAIALRELGRAWSRMSLTTAGRIVVAAVVVGIVMTHAGALRLWAHAGPGSLPILNTLLWAYGVPAVLLFVIAVRARGSDRPEETIACSVLALLLVSLLILFEVRHYFHGVVLPDGYRTQMLLPMEMATYAVAWLLLALGLREAERRHSEFGFERFGVALLWLVLGLLAIALLVSNPLLTPYDVGAALLVNRLLWIYGLPAVLLLAAGLRDHSPATLPLARALRIGSLVLFFLLITTQVRQYFHGAVLSEGDVLPAEQYTYSAAWIVFGIVLLAVGIWSRSVTARYASLAVMMLAVGKVFIIDTAHLRDLYRVFSFLGLGVSLLLLAYFYQKFVFRRAPDPAGHVPF